MKFTRGSGDVGTVTTDLDIHQIGPRDAADFGSAAEQKSGYYCRLSRIVNGMASGTGEKND